MTYNSSKLRIELALASLHYDCFSSALISPARRYHDRTITCSSTLDSVWFPPYCFFTTTTNARSNRTDLGQIAKRGGLLCPTARLPTIGYRGSQSPRGGDSDGLSIAGHWHFFHFFTTCAIWTHSEEDVIRRSGVFCLKGTKSFEEAGLIY